MSARFVLAAIALSTVLACRHSNRSARASSAEQQHGSGPAATANGEGDQSPPVDPPRDILPAGAATNGSGHAIDAASARLPVGAPSDSDTTSTVDAFARPDAPADDDAHGAPHDGADASEAVGTGADSAMRGRGPIAAAGASAPVPLVRGLTLVSALHFPEGDRESVIRVEDMAAEGATFSWRFRQSSRGGDSTYAEVARLVRASDLASAPRLNGLFRVSRRVDASSSAAGSGGSGGDDAIWRADRDSAPGFTSFILSRSAYNRVSAEHEIPYSIAGLDQGPLGTALAAVTPVDLTTSRIVLRGTLSMASSAPEAMPMLLNGRRTTVPVVHLAGRFALQDRQQAEDYWVLADSADPLILRQVVGHDVEQVVRIDFPFAGELDFVEQKLAKECRVELPGVYFDFASARLQPASAPALANLAALLKRHGDWVLEVEGHTDSIGDPGANLRLSNARADAVRSTLVTRYGIAASRLRSVGYAATRPREPNTTLEGRARNRRVELSRKCDGATQ